MAEYTPSADGDLKDELDRLERVFKQWKDAKLGAEDWHTEARESYDFVAGHQWTPDDLAFLAEQQRPAITFNRLGVMVDAVCGLEIANRQDITYLPREQGDVRPNEILSAAADWVRENCHGDDEDSEVFRDASICGIGVSEMRMDYDDDADGKIIDERRDPLKYFPDAAANKKCLEDARYFFYADWMDNREIENRWPDKFSNATPWGGEDDPSQPQNADMQFLYKDAEGDQDKRKDQSLVLHYQCWEREPFYRALDPETHKLVTFEKSKFMKVRKIYEEQTGKKLRFILQHKKVYYRGFYQGRTELEWEKSPYQNGFTFTCMTCKRDRNRKVWYGIVRAMKDPARWANKWLSQILHIINTNAKGGAFVEENALLDPRKAEGQWAAANPLIMLNEGGIEKIKDRTPAPVPAGLDRLMTLAFESLPFVSGINLEALGLANREQAGVLEEKRKKSAFGILSPLFDALKLYRKQKGKVLLYFIREYISDGRLIKVTGDKGDQQYLPLIRKEDAPEYDIIISESPFSPDFREKQWEAMKEILPVMLKTGMPFPPSALDAAPLPSKTVQEWKKLIQQPVPPQIQKQMQDMQRQLQQLGQENQKLQQENLLMKVDTQVEMSKLSQRHADSTQKIGAHMHEVLINATVEKMNVALENAVKQIIAHAQIDSNEKLKIAEIVTKFKEDTNATAKEIGAPVKQQMDKLDKHFGDIKTTAAEHGKAITDLAAEVKKKRKKKTVITKQGDGKYQVLSEEVV